MYYRGFNNIFFCLQWIYSSNYVWQRLILKWVSICDWWWQERGNPAHVSSWPWSLPPWSHQNWLLIFWIGNGKAMFASMCVSNAWEFLLLSFKFEIIWERTNIWRVIGKAKILWEKISYWSKLLLLSSGKHVIICLDSLRLFNLWDICL